MRVTVKVIETESDTGQPMVQAECTRCNHLTESFGTTDRSVKRCLVLLREECPNNEENFYVDEDD